MNMKHNLNSSPLKEYIDALEERMKRALTAVASDGAADMVRRVKAGKDLKDQTMGSYSEAYEEKRREKGKQTKVKDLSFTGRMLGSVHALPVVKEGDRLVAKVTLTDATSKKIGLYNQKRIPWFGFSPNNMKQVQESLKEQIAIALKG